MTITIEKKHVYAFLGIVALLIVCIFCYRSCSKADYETTAKDMKMNTRIAMSLATEILSDYKQNWSSAISDHRAINEKGESVYCSDFNEAISWRFLYYSLNGKIKVLDSISSVVKEDMRAMDNPPSKFNDTQKSFLELYNDMNTLVSLVKNPKGTLVNFSQKVNDIMMDAENRYNETDLKIAIDDSELSEKVVAIQNALSRHSKELEEIKNKVNEAAYKENKSKNEEFMTKKAMEDGVMKLEKGVLYKVIKAGSGQKPKERSMVKLHYEGKTIDGKIFDSSYKNGSAISMRADQVIDGITVALTNMPVGSIWEVYIPQDMAYKEKEVGDIKPYSAVIFKLELIKIEEL